MGTDKLFWPAASRGRPAVLCVHLSREGANVDRALLELRASVCSVAKRRRVNSRHGDLAAMACQRCLESELGDVVLLQPEENGTGVGKAAMMSISGSESPLGTRSELGPSCTLFLPMISTIDLRGVCTTRGDSRTLQAPRLSSKRGQYHKAR
jgi:hypothetical protein